MSDMQYTAGTVAPNENIPVRFQSDSAGRLKVAATSTPATVGTGTAAAAGRVVLADNGGPTDASRIVSAAADTNTTSAKASAGVLYHARGYNAAAAVRYLKFYNKATAPTVGTDTPVLTLALPPSAAFSFDWPIGRYFATGIGYGMVTGAADNSTTALTAADVLGLNVEYR